MGPDFVPYLQTGQVTGMINGMKGCAEYEKLRNDPRMATAGLTSLTMSHLVMFLFIGIGNLIYFMERKKTK